MRLLRRPTTSESPEETAPTDTPPIVINGARTPGKGRPTPKRREAQTRRSGPVAPPPRTRREAYRRAKEHNSTQRSRTREAMKSGDERYLPRRDRGPVRRLVRDIVDSRRNAAGLFLMVAIVVFVTYLFPSPLMATVGIGLWAITFVVMVFDSIYLGRKIRRLIKQRFPDHTESTAAVLWYAFSRALMIRRMRMPAPQVDVGDKV